MGSASCPGFPRAMVGRFFWPASNRHSSARNTCSSLRRSPSGSVQPLPAAAAPLPPAAPALAISWGCGRGPTAQWTTRPHVHRDLLALAGLPLASFSGAGGSPASGSRASPLLCVPLSAKATMVAADASAETDDDDESASQTPEASVARIEGVIEIELNCCQ